MDRRLLKHIREGLNDKTKKAQAFEICEGSFAGFCNVCRMNLSDVFSLRFFSKDNKQIAFTIACAQHVRCAIKLRENECAELLDEHAQQELEICDICKRKCACVTLHCYELRNEERKETRKMKVCLDSYLKFL